MGADGLQGEAIGATLERAVAAHACTHPALQRLRVNLEAYLLNRPPVALDGTTPLGVAQLPPAPGDSYRDSDYARFLTDLLMAESGRKDAPQLTEVRVVARDPVGRPAKLAARYQFLNEYRANLTLHFVDGSFKPEVQRLMGFL